jgi:hypothetical protein
VKADHFDSLTRELAGGISRRQALRLLGGAVLGAALSRACVLSGDDGGVAPICFPPIPCGTTTCNCGWDVCCGGRECCQVQTPRGQRTGNRCCGGICCRKELRCCNGVCNPNLSNDPINCGACGNVCPRDSRCVEGRCCNPSEQACDICWQPSVLAPVFFGIKDFGVREEGAPVALRVFYPSIDGAPHDAPFLEECGAYPLVLFLHGWCNETEHYKKWHHLPAQLALRLQQLVVFLFHL